MTALYPRLASKEAFSLWEDFKSRNLVELRELSGCSNPSQYYASTGGTPVPEEALRSLGGSIREVAVQYGFPESRSAAQAANFDSALAAWLWENLDIIKGEAFRHEVWAFLSLCVVPDVVKWRFPGFHHSRCLGGRRNCLQRLWLRGLAFDLGETSKNRWILLQTLTEDAFVSVMERPTLSGNRKICLAIGTVWRETEKEIGRGQMESVNRDAIRRLRAKSVLYFLDSLDYKSLKKLVQECYRETIDGN